jgi:hypothetical protein
MSALLNGIMVRGAAQWTEVPLVNTPKIPKEGPRCIPLNLDFSSQASYGVDLTQAIQQAQVSLIQSAFIDNSGNTSTLVITIDGTGQQITFPASSQGYLMLLCRRVPKFTFASAGSVKVTILLSNIAMQGMIWPQGGMGGGVSLGYTPLDRAQNLSDLASVSTARTNLGLGSAATQASSAFDAAGSATAAQAAAIAASDPVGTAAAAIATALLKANNLSGLTSVSTARTNLGLGSAATQASSAFDAAGAAASAQAAAIAACDASGAAAAAQAAAIALIPVFKVPYLQVGSSYYIAGCGKACGATLPGALTLATLGTTNAITTQASVGTNGNLILQDAAGGGPFYYGATATTSVEMEFQANGTSVTGGQAGIYIYDLTHGTLFAFFFTTGGGTTNSVMSASYGGGGTPTLAGVKGWTSTSWGILAYRAAVISGQLNFFVSLDSGGSWTNIYTSPTTGVGVSSAGIYFTKAVVNVLNLVIV